MTSESWRPANSITEPGKIRKTVDASRTPICLSYHPPIQRPQEVVTRAKKSALRTTRRESLSFLGRSISQSDFPSASIASTAPFALADQGTSEVGQIHRPEAVERTTGMGCGCHPPE